MENIFQKHLASQPFVLLDGALATELERHGADLNDPLWSAKVLLENPYLIRQVHLEYLAAGADVITTASYQATYEGFAKRGINLEETTRLLRLSVELAKAARDEFWSKKENRKNRLWPLVAASIGPYGAYLADGSEYRGRYGLSVEQLQDFHQKRLHTLAGAGPDLLACETIPCQEEALALMELLGKIPHAQAWLSFSCRDGAHLSDGSHFSEAVALANACPQVVAVGVNCTAPEFMFPLLEIAKKNTPKPLVAYPNSGESWDAGHHCWLAGSATATWEPLDSWLHAGAKLVGGCCRTGPADTAQLATQLKLIAAAISHKN